MQKMASRLGSATLFPVVVRFFNTYEPVTDFYRDLIPRSRSAASPAKS
jgi:hypothetical protein